MSVYACYFCGNPLDTEKDQYAAIWIPGESLKFAFAHLGCGEENTSVIQPEETIASNDGVAGSSPAGGANNE